MNRIINPLVADFMVKTSTKLFNAANSGDPEYARAVLENFRDTVDSYIQSIQEG
jgi:hypothetical protein